MSYTPNQYNPDTLSPFDDEDEDRPRDEMDIPFDWDAPVTAAVAVYEAPLSVASYVEQDAFAAHEAEERAAAVQCPFCASSDCTLDQWRFDRDSGRIAELWACWNCMKSWTRWRDAEERAAGAETQPIVPDAFVRITPFVSAEHAPARYGFVECVNERVQYALVREGKSRREWFSFEELTVDEAECVNKATLEASAETVTASV